LVAHTPISILIIISYLIDRLCEAQSWVQTGTCPEREIVANAKDVSESQCFQEEVASFRILILALCQGQVEQGEQASLQDFLSKNSGVLESLLSCILIVLVKTIHSTLRIEFVTSKIILDKYICEKQAKEGPK